ncbi:hypothetical protein QA612_17525 [Evansella sp. AB-P1]|uniref:CBO0543 family protein n=1 Tax=Evansella sp. AB-P1 TaxID=3037653 RepID=UPI00241E3606|nr:CBO0543 family protein [Evansella sp. AB-P1]MDG5789263.1 hypothetical protein [Evansella sp. AB-P1]
MIHLSIKLLFVLAAWKWGDWRNWQKYYPTILFFILGDLAYNYIFYDYTLWEFDERIPLLKYDTFLVFSFMLLRYPATVLIFLGKFPKGMAKGTAWISLWVIIYIGLEMFDLKMGLIEHHNGWNLLWSFVFDIMLFVIIKIHHHRPIIAWALTIICSIILWNLLNVPIDILK